MGQLVIRLVINAVALAVAAYIVPGMGITNDVVGLAIVAVVFGVVNALIKPIVSILSCPLTILTLGLFTFVINALMLMLTGWLTGGIALEGFLPALLGGVVVSIVSTLLSMFLSEDD